jgi:hypothetical protein
MADAFFAPLIQNPKSQIQNPPAPEVLRLRLVGANPAPRVVGQEELPGKTNYLIGNDPAKWRTNVPNYAQVRYEGVYPGIDLVYYGKEPEVRSQNSEGKNDGPAMGRMELEFDFVVAPGADPRAIRFALETGNSKIENGQSKIPNPNRKSLLMPTATASLTPPSPIPPTTQFPSCWAAATAPSSPSRLSPVRARIPARWFNRDSPGGIISPPSSRRLWANDAAVRTPLPSPRPENGTGENDETHSLIPSFFEG